MASQKNLKVQTEYVTSYNYFPVETSDRVYIFLHGFKQDGLDFYNSMLPYLGKQENCFVPNGPYIVPVKVKEEYQTKYSWYFFDIKNSGFIRDMSLAMTCLKAQVESESLVDKKKTIVGFSQGGYLAPYLASQLTNVDKIIGIHCRFRYEDFEMPFPCPIYAVHGQYDMVVNPNGARESFNQLMAKGNQGEFILVPGVGHSINKDVGQIVADLMER